jgi:uncharacterized protein with von Willebrand factor type A (vWA) domain
MKARIAALIAALRRAEIAVSIAEAMDAAQAAARAGVERPVLREALAATLIKDERDRPVFLAAFEATFPARVADVGVVARKRGRRAGAGEAGGGGSHAAGAATGAAAGAPPGAAEPGAERPDGRRAARPSARARTGSEPERAATPAARGGDAADDEGAAEGPGRDHARALRERHLLRLPFRAMTPADVDACADLARAIAARVTTRVRRRLAPRPTGRLDFRRTIRAAVSHGGVPFERRYRDRRPGAPNLVALCDLSASAAVATGFFLSVLAPAAAYFRRVRLFGFVDRLVEIEFVAGQVRPAAPIDLMARSDFGRVLQDLDRAGAEILGADTVLLVLGDARNNRRPPRADLLAAARTRVRRLVWLNPDPIERWNAGDSVIDVYARHADVLVACGALAELDRALGAVTML